MNEALDFEDEMIENEEVNRPSLKHSLVQTNIAGTLFSDDRFTTFIELSLDASSIDSTDFGLKAKDELVPDISIYFEPPKID